MRRFMTYAASVVMALSLLSAPVMLAQSRSGGGSSTTRSTGSSSRSSSRSATPPSPLPRMIPDIESGNVLNRKEGMYLLIRIIRIIKGEARHHSIISSFPSASSIG